MKSSIYKINLYALCLFLVGCSGFFYYPDKVLYRSPKNFGIEFQDIFFKSLDQTKLNGWHLKRSSDHKESKGTIVFFHGNAQNISSHFINLSWITKEGYELFIFDYRGYGRSEGSPNPKGINKDAIAALEYAYQKIHLPNQGKKFIVYGQSLGGVISMRALFDWKYKNKINLVVMDSTFSSYSDVGFDKLKSSWATLLVSPLSYLIVDNSRASKEYLPKLSPIPLLVIHGNSDKVISHHFGREIYKLANKPKYFWKIEGGRHLQIFWPPYESYRKKFINLLKNI